MIGDRGHLAIAHEDALHAHRSGEIDRLVEHVAAADEVLRTRLVEDRPAVHVGGHREGDPTGHVGLDQPGHHVDARALRGEDQMDPDGARLLRDLDDGILHLATFAHDQVGQLVDDEHDEWQARIRGHLVVVARDIADRAPGEQLVALLHLMDRPVECGLGLVWLHDDVLEEVGQAVVRGELDPLEVHQDQPDLVRSGVHEDARDERIDTDALARPCRPGHEQVGHLGQVHGEGFARHVAAQGEGQSAGRGQHVGVLDERPEPDDLAGVIGDLDPHHVLARNGCLDPNGAGCQGHRQVVRQALDPGKLDVGLGLDFVLGDHGTAVGGDDLGRDLEAAQLVLDDLDVAAVIDPRPGPRDRALLQHGRRRQDPGHVMD